MRYGPLFWREAREEPEWSELSSKAATTFIALCGYADKDNVCYPSAGALSHDTQMSRKTIYRALEELEKVGFVRRIGYVHVGQISPVSKRKLEIPQGHVEQEGHDEPRTEDKEGHSKESVSMDTVSMDTGGSSMDTGSHDQPYQYIYKEGEESGDSCTLDELVNFHLEYFCRVNGIASNGKSTLINQLNTEEKVQVICTCIVGDELVENWNSSLFLKGLIKNRNHLPLQSRRWTEYLDNRTSPLRKLISDLQTYGRLAETNYANSIRNEIGQSVLDYIYQIVGGES